MREVSGSTWVFQLMIIFILIFACFLTLVLSYSKAYRVKNQVLTIIEKYEGVTSTSEDIINNYLRGESYLTKGTCPEGWYGVDINGSGYTISNGNTSFSYCFQEGTSSSGLVYYDIMIFYRFYLPIFGEIMVFTVNGTTSEFIGSTTRY